MEILYRQATPEDAEDISNLIYLTLQVTSSLNYTDVSLFLFVYNLVGDQ